MKDKKIIILIILGAAGILSLMRGISVPVKGKGGISLTPEGSYFAQNARLEKLMSPVDRRAKKTGFSSFKRNIFSFNSGGLSGLTGIIWDEKSPRAIIDDVVVGIGERVGGNTVVEIQKDMVILNDGATNSELRLK
ncbi:MAG: hypothetical protein WDL87_08855 [Candidatus Omnitrophota bacterium]|jgi:hypothetical protein